MTIGFGLINRVASRITVAGPAWTRPAGPFEARRCWLEFGRDRRGGVLPLIGVFMFVAAGAAAFGIDYARMTMMRQSLQMAADAAALAAVSRLPDSDAARKTALVYVEKNMPQAKHGDVLDPADVEIGTWDQLTRTFTPANSKSEESTGTALRVTTRLAESNGNALKSLFAVALGFDEFDLSATAVAGRGGPPCVIVLDPTAAAALHIGGQAELEAVGCGVQVDSTADKALEIKSKGELEATDICVGGTAAVSTNGSADPTPKEYCPGYADPLAGLALPPVGACDHVNAKYNNSNTTLMPGVYCGGLDIGGKSNITLSPGVYVIKDGPFSLGAQAAVSGTEVMIFLTGNNANVSFKAKSAIDLTAPTLGPYAGILFFQDPNFGGTHDWKGKSSAYLRGVIYFPSGTLSSKNTSHMTPEDSCTVLIVSTLEFDSQGGASVDVSNADCRGGLPGPYRRGIVLLK